MHPAHRCCSCRSGVQLKDKWRNLVKFKHVTHADIQALQRRTSGPWSKKYGLQAMSTDDLPSSTSSPKAKHLPRFGRPCHQLHFAYLLFRMSQLTGNGNAGAAGPPGTASWSLRQHLLPQRLSRYSRCTTTACHHLHNYP
jgi:hypothetical protein